MPETRQARIHGIIGMTNTGKSWYVLNVLIPFHQQNYPAKKQVIVACEDHPDYSKYPIIKPEMLNPEIWKNPKPGTVKRILVNPSDLTEVDHVFDMMNKYLPNSVVYIEDAGSFLPERLKTCPGVVSFIGSSKNQNRDVFFQFWNFNEIPKRMSSWFRTMVIFPVGDVGMNFDNGKIFWPSDSVKRLGAHYYKIKPIYEEVLKKKIAADKMKLPPSDPRAHPKAIVIL